MKTMTIKVVMTEKQYACLIKESAKYPDNSSIEGQLEAAVSAELRHMIDWSGTTVDSNSIEVDAKTK